MHYVYLLSLALCLGAITFWDSREQLVLFPRPLVGLKVITTLVGFYLMWDIAGVLLGIFSTNQAMVSGVHFVTPNLPLEELLFLTFLSYFNLLVWKKVFR